MPSLNDHILSPPPTSDESGRESVETADTQTNSAEYGRPTRKRKYEYPLHTAVTNNNAQIQGQHAGGMMMGHGFMQSYPNPSPSPFHLSFAAQYPLLSGQLKKQCTSAKNLSDGSLSATPTPKSVVTCQMCPQVNFSSTHMYHLLAHLAKHDSNLKRYECGFCGFSSMRMDKMREHIANKCMGASCQMRKDSFFREKLENWARTCFPSVHHQILEYYDKDGTDKGRKKKNRIPRTAGNTVACAKCEKLVKISGASRHHHARTHSTNFRYCCTFCGKKGHMKDNIRLHITRAHGGFGEVYDMGSTILTTEYHRLLRECFPEESKQGADVVQDYDEEEQFIIESVSDDMNEEREDTPESEQSEESEQQSNLANLLLHPPTPSTTSMFSYPGGYSPPSMMWNQLMSMDSSCFAPPPFSYHPMFFAPTPAPPLSPTPSSVTSPGTNAPQFQAMFLAPTPAPPMSSTPSSGANISSSEPPAPRMQAMFLAPTHSSDTNISSSEPPAPQFQAMFFPPPACSSAPPSTSSNTSPSSSLPPRPLSSTSYYPMLFPTQFMNPSFNQNMVPSTTSPSPSFSPDLGSSAFSPTLSAQSSILSSMSPSSSLQTTRTPSPMSSTSAYSPPQRPWGEIHHV